MPAHLERRQQTGNSHFLTFSCHDRHPYLATPEAKSLFERSLEQTRVRYAWSIYAYVVMPEHVHLLVSEPGTSTLAIAVGALKRSVSKQLPQSPFWLPRYFDFNVFSNEKRFEKIHYIHQNPVTRELVARPEDYPWSSFRAYALHEERPVAITDRMPS
jgi:putative transposase